MLRELIADPRRRSMVLLAGVALVAALVYVNSLANGFAYDDEFIVKTRDVVHNLGDLSGLLTSEYWPKLFDSGLYRPLSLLSFAVDWAIWGGRPFGFHLTNILLHAAVSALVVLLLTRFFPWWAALAGGLVFAVHSVHTEAVANVVGRAELLATLFVLCACLVYTRAVRAGRIPVGTVALIALSYALAGFSKEGGVVLPGLLLTTDLALLRGGRAGSLREYVRLRLPLFAVLTAVLLLILAARWAVLGAAIESVQDRVFAPDGSFPTRLFTMARIWPRYFELLLFPADLSADYSPAVILPASRLTPFGAAGFLIVLATVLLAAASLRRAPEFAMAVGWVAIALLPVSNLIITAEIVLAERTLYLPSVAVAVLAAVLLTEAAPGRRRWVGLGLLLWLLGFSAVTVRRNPVWDSTDTVFEDLRRRHPESSRVLFGIGSQYYRAGQWGMAHEWFQKSFKVWPYHAPYRAEYALILLEQGELEEAERMAAGAVDLNPDFPGYYELLALIRLSAGDVEGVLATVDRGLEKVGADAVLYSLQADAYVAMGDLQRAIRAQEVALRVREGGPDEKGWYRLALFRAAAGDTAAALLALRQMRGASQRWTALADSVERAWRALP